MSKAIHQFFAEVTDFSIITDYKKGIKYPITDFEITPDVASDDEKIAALIAYLRRMNDDLNIPHCIKNYGADSYQH